MNPTARGGPFWTPITPQTGSFFHAESQLPGSGDVEIRVVLLGAANRPPISVEPFGLRFCRHALARALDRSLFAVDLGQAMDQAHDALMRVGVDVGKQLFDLPRPQLPSAGGCFLAVRQPIEDGSPMLSARTWISADQAFPDQERNLAVWKRFLSNDFAVEVQHGQDYARLEKHRRPQELS